MAVINHKARTLRVKIVYYGPGLCGKTTNLAQLHERFPEPTRGRLVTLDTESERTLFFDHFPAHLGEINGLRLQVDFFTVPGQSFYNETRTTLLQQVDGVVFVADSDPRRESANLVSWDNLTANLAHLRRSMSEVPCVLQYNKRDMRGATPISVLQKQLNPKEQRRSFEAVASQGKGVWETQQAILVETVKAIRHAAQEAAHV